MRKFKIWLASFMVFALGMITFNFTETYTLSQYMDMLIYQEGFNVEMLIQTFELIIIFLSFGMVLYITHKEDIKTRERS